MRLSDLRPVLKAGSLLFDCPMCGEHKIRIEFGPGQWSIEGDVDNATVKPSIRSETKPRCLWHGYVTDGKIVTLSDSKLS